MAVKATSLNNYRQILRNHLLPEFGERKEISEDDVQRFIVRKLSEGCSVSYVRGLCKVLSAVVKYAAFITSLIDGLKTLFSQQELCSPPR